ncbi:hypothetical protein GCM10010289_74170 [Streptomyces violascens]|nr:hypothetical protein GCM10010289_74170 [Streptomyces violascens]
MDTMRTTEAVASTASPASMRLPPEADGGRPLSALGFPADLTCVDIGATAIAEPR